MPCHTPRLYAKVVSLETGEILRRLGPYASASAARVACGKAAGQALVWSREGEDWTAELAGQVYRVPAAEAVPTPNT